MFYTFHQNNSGGSFEIDPARGISVNVFVEASTPEEANARAEEIGLYFNGCDSGMDCDCCGDRWYAQWGDEGTEVPESYGKPVTDEFVKTGFSIKWAGDQPEGYIHYLSGEVKPVQV